MKKLFTILFLMAFAANILAQCPTIPDCPLPVSIKSFTAKTVKNGNIILCWETESEQNANTFEVERSVNGIDFSRIASIRCNNKPSIYAYTDDTPLSIGSYYRLKQVDFDGKSEVFKALFVEKENSKLTIFPNPTTTLVNIVSQQTIAIYDLTGRLFRSVEKGSVTISDLPKGVYIARSGTEQQRIIVQ